MTDARRYFVLHSHVHHNVYALLPSVTGLLAAPSRPLADPREQSGGGLVGSVALAERRRGSSMAKVKRPRRKQEHSVRSCAWCTHLVHGDAVTVTFPDKEQATFHVACLDQYRAVMWPWAAR
jgi:hypothetical protein